MAGSAGATTRPGRTCRSTIRRAGTCLGRARRSAGGAALAVATALRARRAQLPPRPLGVDRLADGYALDLVGHEPRAASLRTALVVARGYGGFNSALVVAADSRGSKSPEGP